MADSRLLEWNQFIVYFPSLPTTIGAKWPGSTAVNRGWKTRIRNFFLKRRHVDWHLDILADIAVYRLDGEFGCQTGEEKETRPRTTG